MQFFRGEPNYNQVNEKKIFQREFYLNETASLYQI